MKSLGDAIHLRNRLIAHLEEADTECSANLRRPLLTFVVAGGGIALRELIYAALDDGSLPCDEPWPKDNVWRCYKRWMDEGMAV